MRIGKKGINFIFSLTAVAFPSFLLINVNPHPIAGIDLHVQCRYIPSSLVHFSSGPGMTKVSFAVTWITWVSLLRQILNIIKK